jgi:hypothetical protein
MARALRCFLVRRPRIIIGNSTFSKADIVASRLNVWKTNPAPSATRHTARIALRKVEQTDFLKTKLRKKRILRIRIDNAIEYSNGAFGWSIDGA